MVLYRRLRAWLHRNRLEAELREELAQHAAWKTESLMAEGVDEPEARRRAAVAVGNATRHRERARGIWGFPSIDSLLQDVRYGARVLTRSPAFTGFAVASLAIGIGAGAAVFSLADTVLFRTMAVRDPASLVLMRWTSGPVSPFSSLNGNGDQNDSGLSSTSFSSCRLPLVSRMTPPDISTSSASPICIRSMRRSMAGPSWQPRTSCPTTTSTCWV